MNTCLSLLLSLRKLQLIEFEWLPKFSVIFFVEAELATVADPDMFEQPVIVKNSKTAETRGKFVQGKIKVGN